MKFEKALVRVGPDRVEPCAFYGFYKHLYWEDGKVRWRTMALVKVEGSDVLSLQYPDDVYFPDTSLPKT
jgi:hypothetical protein